MPLSLGHNRVKFVADKRHALAEGGQIETKTTVRRDSTPIELSSHKLRAIVSPAGHSLGAITVTMSDPSDEHAYTDVVVPIADLLDSDEAATVLFVGNDWPLRLTTFHVERARDDEFELFLITEPR